MPTINEDTQRELTVNFFDAAGVATTPSSVHYRIDCVTNGRQIRGWTAYTDTLANSIEILLTDQDTAILNAANATESRKVQVVTEAAHYEYDYDVLNLREPITPRIVRGDDYADSTGRAIKFTGGLGWPDLTGAAVLLTASSTSVETTLSKAGSIESGTEAGRRKTVLVALTDTETLALDAAANYRYKLTATLSGGDVVTLASGTLVVTER